MKRYIISVLIPIVFMQGCASYSYMTKDEFIEGYIQKNKRSSLKILTFDSTSYLIDRNSYTLISDTLLAKGKFINKQGISRQFEGKIPLNEIYFFLKSEPNYYLIPVMVVLSVALVAGIIFLGMALSGTTIIM